jgi:hypothetical protein
MTEHQKHTAPNVIDLGTRRRHTSGTPCPAPSSGVGTTTQLKEACAKFVEGFEKFERIGIGIAPCESLRPLSIKKRKAATEAALAVQNAALILCEFARDSIGTTTMSSDSRFLVDRGLKMHVIVVLMQVAMALAITTGDAQEIRRVVFLARYLVGGMGPDPGGGGRPLEEDEDHELLPADPVEDPWSKGAA